MHYYYQILGVTSNATLDQIKKAYRKKAKLLHPDVSKAKNAHEQFVLLNEAYEYLLKTTGNSTNRYKRAQEQAQKQAAYQQEWEQKEREKARDRAQAYARMKYKAYVKSDIYKTTEALNLIADFLVTMFILLFVVGLPVFSYIEHGPVSLIFCAIIILPTSPLWFRFLVSVIGNMHIQSLYKKKEATIRSKMFSLVTLFIINLIVFFRVALNTLIELEWIIGIYGLAFIIGFLLSASFKGRFIKYLIRFAFAPGLISILFLINFFITSNPKTEAYWYSYNYSSAPIFTSIELKDDAYQQYKGIRFFLAKETVMDKACIQYSFKDGMLGFKVAHHRELSYSFQE